jgi:zinc transporter ZupT
MQAANKRKTILLIAMMASLTAFVVYVVGLYFGVASTGLIPLVVFISVGGTWWSYYDWRPSNR